MRVFLSWSGPPSKAAAEALKGWLPEVIQSLVPWMSVADIAAGGRWSPEIAKELDDADYGIACVTRANVSAPWLNFEAGALAKSLGNLCPYLIQMGPAEIPGDNPLSQFQGKRADMEGTWDLIKALNIALGEVRSEEGNLRRRFDRWWPDLQTQLESLPAEARSPAESPTPETMLAEILVGVRELRAATIASLDDQTKRLSAYTHRLNAIRRRVVSGNVLPELAGPDEPTPSAPKE